METLDTTLKNAHDWSRERIHVLCENGKVEETTKSVDDAFAIFSEFEEWYDEDEPETFSGDLDGTDQMLWGRKGKSKGKGKRKGLRRFGKSKGLSLIHI